MLDDHDFNLYNQLIIEQRGLYHIRKMYKEDASGCEKCRNFWSQLEKDKERQIEELEQLIDAHDNLP